MTTVSPPLTEEPKATSKHTLCGYAWGDVQTALVRSIGTADMARAQRWSAELVCSEQGLGRLEATLFHAWAVHVGSVYPTWCRTWFTTIEQLRALWTRTGGNTKAVRNTPVVRQLVAESVAALVLAAKRPLPTLPTAADCVREAEGIRARIRAGGGVGDQVVTRRVWNAGSDSADIKTVCNEFEAALRSNQVARMLFWVIWVLTLDKSVEPPEVRERGPSHLSTKARKRYVWFLMDVLRELANEGAFLSVEERNGLFGCLETCWMKLGEKGRRDAIAAIALCIQEHLQRKGSLTLSGPTAPPTLDSIRSAAATIDVVYSGIAEEARRYLLEVPRMVGLTHEAERAARSTAKPAFNPMDKLAMAYMLAGRK
jgi:hypothetical protein